LASPSELLASPSELVASPSELLASPSELLASPSELSVTRARRLTRATGGEQVPFLIVFILITAFPQVFK
jgi:hypothetical protein